MTPHATAEIEYPPDLVLGHEVAKPDHIRVGIEPVASHICFITPVFIPPCHGELLLRCAAFLLPHARIGQATLACRICHVKGIPCAVNRAGERSSTGPRGRHQPSPWLTV